MTLTRLFVCTCTGLALTYGAIHISNGALAQLQVPARALPVPTDVSPEMQQIIAAPRNSAWNVLWKTGEEWRAAANKRAQGTLQTIGAMRGSVVFSSLAPIEPRFMGHRIWMSRMGSTARVDF